MRRIKIGGSHRFGLLTAVAWEGSSTTTPAVPMLEGSITMSQTRTTSTMRLAIATCGCSGDSCGPVRSLRALVHSSDATPTDGVSTGSTTPA